MELSFKDVSSGDAAYLTQELKQALERDGAPAQALSLKRGSQENMDLGTILGIDVETALHALGAAGYVACFANCMWEIVRKHEVTIHVTTTNGSVDIPSRGADLEKIEKILAELRNPKAGA